MVLSFSYFVDRATLSSNPRLCSVLKKKTLCDVHVPACSAWEKSRLRLCAACCLLKVASMERFFKQVDSEMFVDLALMVQVGCWSVLDCDIQHGHQSPGPVFQVLSPLALLLVCCANFNEGVLQPAIETITFLTIPWTTWNDELVPRSYPWKHLPWQLLHSV